MYPDHNSSFSVTIILLLLLIPPLASQRPPPVLSTTGRDFLVYPSRVDNLWDRVNLYITTHSSTGVKVRVTTPMLPVRVGGVDMELTVTASQPHIQEIKTRGTNQARGKLMDGIRVQADDDIAVFVNNPSNNASGVTSILSTASLGTDYLFPSIQRTFNGQVSICIGNLDGNNIVRVTLPKGYGVSAPVLTPVLEYKGTEYWPGETITVQLTPYEFADIRDVTSTADLTGTIIKSQRPVAVFSAAVFHMANGLDNVGLPILSSDKDIVIENIPPKRAWGKKFLVTASPSTTSEDSIRVLSAEGSVTLELSTGYRYVIPGPGQFIEMQVFPGASFTITADKPVEIVQYRFNFAEDSAPFMFLVPPLESYWKDFAVPIIFNAKSVVGSQNFIVLNTHACHADRVTIHHSDSPDGQRMHVSKLTSWRPVGDGPYLTSQVKVEAGFVTIAMEPSDDPAEDEMAVVGGYFFGLGPQKAYAAPLGLHVTNTRPLFSASFPVYAAYSTPEKEPILDGHSKLIARDKLPLAFPLVARAVTSRVACHHECWTRAGCLYVAYSKARGAESSDCRLYGATAGCSGLKDSPGFLLYSLSK